MTFSPRLIEAKLALNMVHPEDFPMLAINALEADLDGPTIRKVSGSFSLPDTRQTFCENASWRKLAL
jgi:hypothetical protein